MTNFHISAIGRCFAAGIAFAAMAILPGCVDNDYDLSKDMDLNITVGTDGLTIPGSSTEMLTLDNPFDLNDDGSSSIKTIKAEDPQKYGLNVGDYVLIQKPDKATESVVEIPEVKLDNIAGSTTEVTLDAIMINGMGMQWTDVKDVKNSVSICSYDTPEDVVSLSYAETYLPIDVRLTFATNYSGAVYVGEGFTVTFPSWWKLSLVDTFNAPVRLVSDNVMEFTGNFDIAHNSLQLKAVIDKFDFLKANANITNSDEKQGIVNDKEAGKVIFRVKDDIVCNGRVGADGGQATQLSISQVDVDLSVVVQPTSATLLSVTGVVNPKIDIAESDFQINDIPDFLDDENNHLDLYNPQLYFNIHNPAPVDVIFSAILTPYDDQNNVIKDKDGKDNIVKLGSEYGGQEILIKAADDTHICISRLGTSDASVDAEVTVANLGDLFMTVPSRITITGIKAQVPQNKDYTITPSQTYTESYDYQAVIPFVFGENTTIDYMTSSDDLDTEDFDKFNFEAIELSFNAVNGIPLNLTPHLEAVGEGNRVLTDITCEVTGVIAAATANGASTSKIKAVLRSKADNLSQVKGINASFKAHTDAQCAGIALNKNMGVKFTDVTATLKGNIDIDLND